MVSASYGCFSTRRAMSSAYRGVRRVREPPSCCTFSSRIGWQFAGESHCRRYIPAGMPSRTHVFSSALCVVSSTAGRQCSDRKVCLSPNTPGRGEFTCLRADYLGWLFDPAQVHIVADAFRYPDPGAAVESTEKILWRTLPSCENCGIILCGKRRGREEPLRGEKFSPKILLEPLTNRGDVVYIIIRE